MSIKIICSFKLSLSHVTSNFLFVFYSNYMHDQPVWHCFLDIGDASEKKAKNRLLTYCNVLQPANFLAGSTHLLKCITCMKWPKQLPLSQISAQKWLDQVEWRLVAKSLDGLSDLAVAFPAIIIFKLLSGNHAQCNWQGKTNARLREWNRNQREHFWYRLIESSLSDPSRLISSIIILIYSVKSFLFVYLLHLLSQTWLLDRHIPDAGSVFG